MMIMVRLTLRSSVTCELNGKKTFQRWVGISSVGGADIGAASMVAGLAMNCPRYSGGR